MSCVTPNEPGELARDGGRGSTGRGAGKDTCVKLPGVVLTLSGLPVNYIALEIRPQVRSSVGEHYLDTVGVGSSILPVPTKGNRVSWSLGLRPVSSLVSRNPNRAPRIATPAA